MQTLNTTESHNLLQRFPKIELSYETIPHKKVLPKYNICLAIPVGTKAFAWFTYFGEQDVCFIMETNKEKKINKMSYLVINRDSFVDLCLGTLLYGTFSENAFIIEDILYFKGTELSQTTMGERLGVLDIFCRECKNIDIGFFFLPIIWDVQKTTEYECVYDIPQKYSNKYDIHHIQYRCLNVIAPYLNLYPAKKNLCLTNKPIVNDTLFIPMRSNYRKPIYQQKAVFKVFADIQFDIYRLYCYSNKGDIYYNTAYISNYNTSIFMNKIFRHIKENSSLDAIEESDDEEDFENIQYDKYVDLKKFVLMECIFHNKFKKWIPLKIVPPKNKFVHVSYL